ncbi:MAG: hypothetical protein RIS92_399 [Verrucomicrobiota bacterium]
MVSYGFAVVDCFSTDDGGWPREFEFARDNGTGEITFTNKVWYNIYGLRVHHVEHLAQAGFFLPEGAVDLVEVTSVAECCGVIEGRCAGVWVLGGAVSDDDEGRFFGVGHGGV